MKNRKHFIEAFKQEDGGIEIRVYRNSSPCVLLGKQIFKTRAKADDFADALIAEDK